MNRNQLGSLAASIGHLRNHTAIEAIRVKGLSPWVTHPIVHPWVTLLLTDPHRWLLTNLHS